MTTSTVDAHVPVLSIGIPTWNRARMLGDLLRDIAHLPENLAAQIEIVVSDNASDDETARIVATITQRASVSISYSRNESNIGAVRNVLETLKNSKGRYWTFMGDDDRLDQEGLSRLLAVLVDDEHVVQVLMPDGREHEAAPAKARELTQLEVARELLYDVGNAGRFALLRSEAMRALASLAGEGWTCWPQTELTFVAMAQSRQTTPAQLLPIVLCTSEHHSSGTVYTAYHAAETPFLSLYRVANRIAPLVDSTVSAAAADYAVSWARLTKALRNIVLFKVLSDLPQDVAAFRSVTTRTLALSRPRHLPQLVLLWSVAHSPRWLARLALRLYLFLRWPGHSREALARLASQHPKARRLAAAEGKPGAPRAHQPRDLE